MQMIVQIYLIDFVSRCPDESHERAGVVRIPTVKIIQICDRHFRGTKY